ncbi:o-succinylbenzoate synthase [Saccharopolyspora phatthalungensis]|uniref:o-succinylbenzoate synthase n=1 Tax=Saccharopolyspora phatthalungensis TaxID=664693 RepID=A0A840QGT4_9PSEU|nr:o-succinylbenzoate synthase [Saccharopolyspora phatthalungensis]MBB5159180.1 O-succinylbenzoate synthase [Saccharopolyspora phatthalungensis]
MTNEIDFDGVRIYAIPMRARFRGITVREGMLIEGPAGWGEFCPFADYDDIVAASWLATTIEQCTRGWPEPVRDRIPINCTVPAVGPERAHEIAANSGCRTAKVKVADHAESLPEDLARVEAVRDAIGHSGAIRVDANGVWDVDTAVLHIRQLDKAAGGLEYVEQPCWTVEELAAVRRKVDVRIAADESIRRADDPLRVAIAGAADVAVIKCTPLGGVRRSLEVAEAAGLPCVVSSALETSVGLAAQVALAGALPEMDFACGLGTLSLLDSDLVSGSESLRAVNGYLPIPRTPPTPDPSLLATYELTDPDQASWWRDRLSRVRAVHEHASLLTFNDGNVSPK